MNKSYMKIFFTFTAVKYLRKLLLLLNESDKILDINNTGERPVRAWSWLVFVVVLSEPVEDKFDSTLLFLSATIGISLHY